LVQALFSTGSDGRNGGRGADRVAGPAGARVRGTLGELGEGVLALTLISVVVGLVIALAYHYLSMRSQRWASQKRALMQPAITILGFLVRLAIFVGILLVIGFWSPLNILAVCLSFVVVFTILNGIWLYVLATKRRQVPPPAGTGGAKLGDPDAAG